jgi:hypothetical protein
MDIQEQLSGSRVHRCRLLRPIRDRAGRVHFGESPIILREMVNLDRQMLLVEFGDGATTFVFPEEISENTYEG